MSMRMAFLAFVLALSLGSGFGEPIKVHPDNPHYYLFNGQPTVLITSAEHYGAVVNKAFDYATYFDTLHSYSLNYTRIYPGFLFEPIGKFGNGNTLGVKPADLICLGAAAMCPAMRWVVINSISIAGIRDTSSV